MEKSAPINVTVTCHGWDSVSQSDTLNDDITIGVWVPISGNTGKELDFKCSTPEELWVFLQHLTTDPLKVLKEYHNYTPPASVRVTIPMDLTALFT